MGPGGGIGGQQKRGNNRIRITIKRVESSESGTYTWNRPEPLGLVEQRTGMRSLWINITRLTMKPVEYVRYIR
jgi:hypothetical protein